MKPTGLAIGVVMVLGAFQCPRFVNGAAIINVDFQPGASGSAHSLPYAGQGGLADPGHDFWNKIEPPVDGYTSAWGSGGNFLFPEAYLSVRLLDSTGQETPVTVTVKRGTPLGTTFAVNPSNTWAYSHVADDAKALMSDYLIAPGGGTNEVTVNHLVPGSRYTFYLYGAGDQNTHQTTFTIGAKSQTTLGVPHDSHNLTPEGDYVVFTDVLADNGTVTISYVGAGASRDGNFNGFQMQGEWPGEGVPTAVPAAPTGAAP